MNATSIHRILGIVIGVAIAPLAWSQATSLGDLQQKGAVKLSAEDLKAAAEGAKVSDVSNVGSERYWTNEAGGKFIARSSNAANPGGRPTSGDGTWNIDETGRYCVELKWPRQVEKWCQSIYRTGDKHYRVSGSGPDAKALEISFKK